MHEMSLAQSIVEIVENTAQQNQASSVVAVKLIIGELAGVEMHALMQGLKIASQGTVMQEAKIEIERPGGTAWCLKCQKTVPIHRRGEPPFPDKRPSLVSHRRGSTSSFELNCDISPFTVIRIIMLALPSLFT